MGRGLDGCLIAYLLALCGFQAPPGPGLARFPVAHSEGETPLPIPNRAVKPLSADGTWRATSWESRSPPVLESPKTNDLNQSPWVTLAMAGKLKAMAGLTGCGRARDRLEAVLAQRGEVDDQVRRVLETLSQRSLRIEHGFESTVAFGRHFGFAGVFAFRACELPALRLSGRRRRSRARARRDHGADQDLPASSHGGRYPSRNRWRNSSSTAARPSPGS